MTLEVMHAEGHAVAGPAPIGKGFELNASISQSLPSVHDHLLPLPGSQESQHSTVSKTSAGLSSSLDARSDRQLTPTSSQSGYDLSSPQQLPAYLTSPQASGPLPSYESLTSRDPVHDLPRSPTGINRPSSYYVDPTAGQKRTASGAVKNGRATSAESSDYNRNAQRSRTTSITSRSSQMGELTSQLRARLAYAKVKVQHGWESRTLDEIETITSMPASPNSVKTHSTRALHSPRSAREQQNSEAADRPLTAPSRQLHYGQAPSGHAESAHHGYPISTFGHVPTARGSLAPPLEFSNPKRSPTGTHGIPPLITNGNHSNLSGSSSSSRSHVPSTPPTYPHMHAEQSLQRKTPSQRTMEQDAIETLLFMSSPGNSATFAARPPTLPPPVQAHGPAYHHNLLANDKPMLPPPVMSERPVLPPLKHLSRPDVDSIPISPGRRPLEERVLAGANLHDSQGIDHVLDEMRRRTVVDGESGDSSDEEI